MTKKQTTKKSSKGASKGKSTKSTKKTTKKPAAKKDAKIAATKSVSFKKGDRVSVFTDGGAWKGTVEKMHKSGTAMVADDSNTVQRVKTSQLSELHRGRQALLTSLSTKELHSEIAQIVKELKATTDRDEKKRLRRSLRRRGHKGGLGICAEVVEAR